MAKAKDANKSEEIRKVLTENPGMKAKQVVEFLATQNVTVNEGLVYQVSRKMKGGTAAKKPRAQKAEPVAAAVAANGVLSAGDAVTEVKALARRVGGYAELQKIVTALTTE